MLDFIDDGALAELRQKPPGIGFGKVPLVGRLQVGVGQVGERRPAERRLPGLPRPGHGHEGVLLEQPRQPSGNLALDHARHATERLHRLQVVLSICAVSGPLSRPASRPCPSQGLAEREAR